MTLLSSIHGPQRAWTDVYIICRHWLRVTHKLSYTQKRKRRVELLFFFPAFVFQACTFFGPSCWPRININKRELKTLMAMRPGGRERESKSLCVRSSSGPGYSRAARWLIVQHYQIKHTLFRVRRASSACWTKSNDHAGLRAVAAARPEGSLKANTLSCESNATWSRKTSFFFFVFS